MTIMNSHIIMAAMKSLHIKSLSQILPDDVISDMQSTQERKAQTDSLSVKIVEKFVSFQFSGSEEH